MGVAAGLSALISFVGFLSVFFGFYLLIRVIRLVNLAIKSLEKQTN